MRSAFHQFARELREQAFCFGLPLGSSGLAVFDDLFRFSRCADHQIGQQIDELRKRYRQFVGVIRTVVKRAFMNGVISDNSASLSERSVTIGYWEAFELLGKRQFLVGAEVDRKTLKRESKHCAGASGRAADYALSFQERVFCFLRQMLRRLDGGSIRPDYFIFQSKREVLANLASNKKNFRRIVELCEIFKTNRFITENGIELIVMKRSSWTRAFQNYVRSNQMRTAVRTYQ